MARSVPKSQNPHGLTDQQLRFCQNYAASLNATQAYKAAGYSWKSENVANVSAHQILRNLKIQAYLGEVLNLTNVSVIHETVAIALARITDIASWDESGSVQLLPSNRITDRAKAAIKSIKSKPRVMRDDNTGEVIGIGYETELVMHDKVAAIEKLMRKLSLYPRVEQVTEADILDRLMELEILPPWIADCASKNINRAKQENATLLKGLLPEPLVYELSKERESTGGLSKETVGRIRAEIMGIDAESIPTVSEQVHIDSE